MSACENHPVIDWIEKVLKNDNRKREFAGRQVVLMDWQKNIIRQIWPRSTNYQRVATDTLVLTGKKTGKTSFGAMLCAYCLFENGVEPWPIHWKHTAPSFIQAQYFDTSLREIIKNSGLPAKLLVERIELANDNTYECLSGESPQKQGLNYTHGSIDEAAQYVDKQDHFRDGAVHNFSPFFLYLSNPPLEKENFISDLIARKADTRFIKYMVRCTERDANNWKSEKVWKKYNPSLGHITPLRTYEDKVKKIKHSPAALSDFQRLWLSHFNYSTSEMWVKPKMIKPIKENKIPDHLTWYAGIDLSWSKDLTSLSLVSEHKEKLYIKNYNWIPRKCLEKHDDKNAKEVKQWLLGRNKNLFISKGDLISITEIEEKIAELSRSHEIHENIAVDYAKCAYYEKNFDLPAFNFMPVKQSSTAWTSLVLELETKILQGKCYLLDGNAVFMSAVKNVRLKEPTSAANRMFFKNKSKGPIDALIATANATGLLMKYGDRQDFPEVFKL